MMFMNIFQMSCLPMKERPDDNSKLDDMILNTTASLFKAPALDLYSPAQKKYNAYLRKIVDEAKTAEVNVELIKQGKE